MATRGGVACAHARARATERAAQQQVYDAVAAHRGPLHQLTLGLAARVALARRARPHPGSRVGEPPSPCSPEKPALESVQTARRGFRRAGCNRTARQGHRVRFEPERYGGKNNPEVGKERQYESPALQAQYEANQIMREQLRTNQATIEKAAEDLRCPLAALKPRKVDVTPNGTRHDRPVERPFLGAQMKMVAAMDDGHFYDFTHITRRIRDVHGLLRRR